jgi:outer membrane protein assembly factor BamB
MKTQMLRCLLLCGLTALAPSLLAQNGTEKWRFATNGAVISSPAIGANGTIYIGSEDRNFYALNPDTGAEVWKFTTSGFGIVAPAIAPDGTIYVASIDPAAAEQRQSFLYALNPNGTERWRYAVPMGIRGSPALAADGTIYVGADDGRLHAVTPAGQARWTFQTGAIILSSPTVSSAGVVYVGSDDRNLYAINPDGSQKWIFSTAGPVISSPTIGVDGTIYVGSNDGNVYALNPLGGIAWVYNTGGVVRSSPAIGADGRIYVGSDTGELFALNQDGSLRWRYATGDFIRSSPAIAADGTIYVGSYDRHLYAISPAGTLVWRFLAGDAIISSPAIGADGTVYVGSFGNNVYAVRGGSALAGTHWPKWRQNLAGTGRSPGFVGSYFGNLTGMDNAGRFALLVREDGMGSFLAFSPALNQVMVRQSFSIGADGNFSFQEEGGATVSGSLANGTLSGTVAGVGLSFASAERVTTGSYAGRAAFYSGIAGNEGLAYSIIGYNGEAMIAHLDGAFRDGGLGSMANLNRMSVGTLGGVTWTGDFSSNGRMISGNYAGAGRQGEFTLMREGIAGRDRLVNISTRGRVGTGDNVMIAGFVIEGDTPKRVMVLAKGPMLNQFGVTGTLDNPEMRLVRGGTDIAANSNWREDAGASEIQASGFAPQFDREPGVVMTLAPGPYTAIVSGANQSQGVALVEAYELESNNNGPITSRLINISTRGRVETGDSVMIAGFVVEGDAPRRLLIRGVGPSLAGFGVAGALANPTLRLVAQLPAGSQDLATNDDWQQAGNAAEIAATPYPPSNPLESAILMWFDPGIYTAILSGVNDGTGVGLVEVYDLTD